MKSLLFALPLLLAGAPAVQAFDCGEPAGDVAIIVCGDPEILAAMTEVEASLAAAVAQVPQLPAAALGIDQSVWLAELPTYCAYDDDGAELAAALVPACLASAIRDRSRFLRGAPLEGPGAPEPIVPVALVGADGMINHVFRFADPKGPGAEAFNYGMDATIEAIHMATTLDDTSDSIDVTLTYASPRLLSARVEQAFLGPAYAHPMPTVFGVNIDLETGDYLDSEDAFTAGADLPLVDLCVSQNADYVAAGEAGADKRRGDLEYIARDVTTWHFGASAATAEYLDQFLVRPVTCTFTYDILRPLLKPGFPLPE